MTEAQRKTVFDIREALDSFVKQNAGNPVEINKHPEAVRVWLPGVFLSGDVRAYEGVPYKCIQAHDSAAVPDWTPPTSPALWMQYHGTSKETARPWIAPTGAHDMYLTDEYMIFTDGITYRCIANTAYSPADYAAAWEGVT